MTRLTELEPIMEDWSPNERGYQRFTFLCPSCRKLRVRHAIWSGPCGDVRWKDASGLDCHERVWSATQGPHKDWDSLSLSPSLDMPAHKISSGGECPGWHGHIINGEATP
jgi:hypothetical protein